MFKHCFMKITATFVQVYEQEKIYSLNRTYSYVGRSNEIKCTG